MKFPGTGLLVAVLMVCLCTRHERVNPFDAQGNQWSPPVVTAMNDTAVNINDSIRITATAEDDGTVKKYVWALDGHRYTDTTNAGWIKAAWTVPSKVPVGVMAIDDDCVRSTPDSCVITVTLDPPLVTAMPDTNVNINDSLTVTATATDNGRVMKYVWAKEGTSYSDTTDSLKVAYSDSGRESVQVVAIDDDGLVSVLDSCVITVTLDAPIVTAMDDASVNINDSLTVTATATDNGRVVKYVWAKDGGAYSDTTDSRSLKVAYSDSGRRVVRVMAIDDDVVVSAPDSCVVTVTLDAPVLTARKDTTVSFSTTTSVTVEVFAVDTNMGGSIGKYYWDIGADGWDDSTDADFFAVTSSTGSAITVRWAARDDDGLFSYDTFTVAFNRAPGPVMLSTPSSNEAWVSFDWSAGKGTLPLTMSASDPDSAADTITFTLSTGPAASSLTHRYTGTGRTYDLTGVDSSATVYYSLVARDCFGDSTVSTGTLVAPPYPPPAGMVLITGGNFQMGSTTGDGDEQPVHTITVSDFWLDTTEVTQKQYGDLMSTTYNGYSSQNWSGKVTGDNNPVYDVNWYDAVLYCNARTKASGSSDTVYCYSSISGTPGNDCLLSGVSIDLSKSGYRLPTEAEWEYACRAGTTTDYYWGSATAGDYTWYEGNSGSGTHPVAQKLPNSYGLYDMSGNVWEWCNDWYGSYSSESATDPTGPSSGSRRVVRGGNWRSHASPLRSANRYDGHPDGAGVGLRVALPAR